MTKQEFESYISPIYLTFDTFKQAIKNSIYTSSLNIESAIVKEVLNFDDTSVTYPLSTNEVAILLNCSNNNRNGSYSLTLGNSANIRIQLTYPGAMFISSINAPATVPAFVDQYTFLIIRFN